MRKKFVIIGSIVLITVIAIIAIPLILNRQPAVEAKGSSGNALIPVTGQKVIFAQYQYRSAVAARPIYPQYQYRLTTAGTVYPQYQYRFAENTSASQGVYPQYQYRSAKANNTSPRIYPQYQYRSTGR